MNRHDLPVRLAGRPFDQRRQLPVPYVNEHGPGSYDFAVVNGRRAVECAREQLCGACGHFITRQLTFVGGLANLLHNTYTDPPMHTACTDAALQLCPFLARPRRRPRPTTATAMPAGYRDLDRSRPLAVAITDGYATRLTATADGVLLEFHPEPWQALHVFAYTDAGLVPTAAAAGADAVTDLIQQLRETHRD
ncbi:hypothetical protein AB0B66_10395 [Catellatospora sp. NPDC049111]|uniref:hypothetical protein n=1 Tax=Catellatospora sp. NPDC049111 TaxID=3155271 RepID=UPI0033C6DCB3